MSHVLYESDNINIYWEIWEIISIPFDSVEDLIETLWNTNDSRVPTIRLSFCIHVNGKLKTIFHEFKIVYEEYVWPDGEKSFWEYSLENWERWNSVLSTLKDIGYLQDITWNEIRKWIQSIYKN